MLGRIDNLQSNPLVGRKDGTRVKAIVKGPEKEGKAESLVDS